LRFVKKLKPPQIYSVDRLWAKGAPSDTALAFHRRRSQMKVYQILPLVLAGALAASVGLVQGKTDKPVHKRGQSSAASLADVPDREIYGYWYTTGFERELYRQRLREAKNAQEEAQVLADHYERVQARAKAAGATLPDPPVAGSRRAAGK
jgi:hypothetical protein